MKNRKFFLNAFVERQTWRYEFLSKVLHRFWYRDFQYLLRNMSKLRRAAWYKVRPLWRNSPSLIFKERVHSCPLFFPTCVKFSVQHLWSHASTRTDRLVDCASLTIPFSHMMLLQLHNVRFYWICLLWRIFHLSCGNISFECLCFKTHLVCN